MESSPTQPPQPEVHFEPGIHTLSQSSSEQLDKKVRSGKVGANQWNQAVTERLADYSPEMIAIDSLVCPHDKRKLTIDDKVNIWEFMPDRPTLINGTDSINVLLGDNIYNEQPASDLVPSGLALADAGAIFIAGNLGGVQLDKMAHGWRKWMAGYDNVSGNFDDELASKVSRRNFFRIAGSIAAVAVFTSDRTAAYSPWQSVTSFFSRIADVQQHYSPEQLFTLNKYVEGRTALLIQKMYDGLSATNQKVGSVILGSGHINDSVQLLHDQEFRLDLIVDHTKLLLDAAPTGLGLYSYDKENLNTRVNFQIDAILQMQNNYAVVSVSEPDNKRFKKDALKEIDRIVKLDHYFTSEPIKQAIGKI